MWIFIFLVWDKIILKIGKTFCFYVFFYKKRFSSSEKIFIFYQLRLGTFMHWQLPIIIESPLRPQFSYYTWEFEKWNHFTLQLISQAIKCILNQQVYYHSFESVIQYAIWSLLIQIPYTLSYFIRIELFIFTRANCKLCTSPIYLAELEEVFQPNHE